MGLLESVLGSVLGSGSGQQQNTLAKLATGLITNYGSGKGLPGLVQQFQQRGLGDLVSSWVGTGENKPANPEQIEQALGDEQIQEISQQTGLQRSQVASQLAEMLPKLINHVTPNGEVPANNDVQSMLGNLLRSVGQNQNR